MARRSRRGVPALLITLVLAACAATGGDQQPSSTTVHADEATVTTATPPTTTTTTAVATTTTPTTTTTSDSGEVDGEVTVPEGNGPFPSVVLVHGGSWVTGNFEIMEPLADHLNDNGFLTVNTSYTLSSFDVAGFPGAVEDVACAVRLAAGHADSDGTVAVIGHSAGAHIGALVALTGDDYVGGCDIPGSGIPDRFVGLGGPYDVSRLGLAIVAFFGGGPDRLPDAWEAGNPQLLTDRNPDVDSLILYGELDGIVNDSFAVAFHEALVLSGSESLLELVEGARHNDLHDPDFVGDLIVTWLDR